MAAFLNRHSVKKRVYIIVLIINDLLFFYLPLRILVFTMILEFLSIEDNHDQTAHSWIILLIIPAILKIDVPTICLLVIMIILVLGKKLGSGDLLPIIAIQMISGSVYFSATIMLASFSVLAQMTITKVRKLEFIPSLTFSFITIQIISIFFQ
jgi:hypothetical protein